MTKRKTLPSSYPMLEYYIVMTVARVKICGITRIEDAVAAEKVGADAIGLIFAEHSKRRVSMEQALAISGSLGPFISRVGVFVNQPLHAIETIAKTLRLDALQLHGEEDAEFVKALSKNYRIIKAICFENQCPQDYLNFPADALLLDGLKPGSGTTFNWSVAAAFKGFPKLILAGGLTPKNVRAGITALEPYAVDTASGVEETPGIKNHTLLHDFLRAAKGF
ncbi:MAG: phosphoribosylanthranilate isomerase [Trueperaceae bacterium]